MKSMEVSKQIDATTVNLLLVSLLQEELGLPINIPQIFGGDAIIKDELARTNLEDALGQLNVIDLFVEQETVLEIAKYDTWNTVDKEKLTPHIYLLKQSYDHAYLLNVLVTPYADINVTMARDELKFIATAFNGIFRRTRKQIELGQINSQEQISELKKYASKTGSFYHWQLFSEKSLRGGIESLGRAPMIVGAMYLKGEIKNNETQCIGTCGKTYETESYPPGSTCECGGKIISAPPYVTFNELAFVLPANIQEIIPEHIVPNDLVRYITDILVPRGVSLTLNRISSEYFGDIVSIPTTAYFTDKQTNDFVKVQLNYHITEDRKITLFACIADSRYNNPELVSSMSLPVIMRTIKEGIKEGEPLMHTLKRSELKDWILTSFIKLNEVANYLSFKEILER